MTMTQREWDTCYDGAAMFIALRRRGDTPGSETRRLLVLAACECVRYAAASAAVESAVLRECADIVRKHFPEIT